MSFCCAYVKWAQPIAFAHSLCDLLSHTMSALLSPVLMLCNLLCRSAAGSSPLRTVAHFATSAWPRYRRMLCNLLLCPAQALLSRWLQPVGPQRSRRAASRDALGSAVVSALCSASALSGLLSKDQRIARVMGAANRLHSSIVHN